MPVEAALMAPLLPLTELAAHEQKFLPRVRPHPGIEEAEVGKFLPPVTGHLIDHGALPMNDLIVAENQDEVFIMGIEHGEGGLPMMILPMDGLMGDVAEAVIHPAHVPFEAKAQTALTDGTRYTGPSGALFRDHEDAGMLFVAHTIEMPHETDGLQVLATSVVVRHPLTGLTGVVEVEHRGHGIDAEAIDVIFLDPKESIGDEEVLHLIPAVIEDQRAPVLMLALTWISMFKERRSIELGQPMLVLREVTRHPVHDDAKPGLMTAVHELAELVWISKTARGCKITRDLVSPGTIEGMLGEPHQLQVREAETFCIRDQLIRQLAIR